MGWPEESGRTNMFFKTLCLLVSLVLLAVVDQSEGGPGSQRPSLVVKNRVKVDKPKTNKCADVPGGECFKKNQNPNMSVYTRKKGKNLCPKRKPKCYVPKIY